MGVYFFDTYSILHFAVGIIAYYWGMSLGWWSIINLIYECLDNIFLLNVLKKISIWPGGKKARDTLKNSLGDFVFGILGWFVAALLDMYIETNSLDLEIYKKLIKKGKKDSLLLQFFKKK